MLSSVEKNVHLDCKMKGSFLTHDTEVFSAHSRCFAAAFPKKLLYRSILCVWLKGNILCV